MPVKVRAVLEDQRGNEDEAERKAGEEQADVIAEGDLLRLLQVAEDEAREAPAEEARIEGNYWTQQSHGHFLRCF